MANYGVNSGKKSSFSEAELQELITLLLRAGWQLRNALVPTLPLELVVAEWCGQQEINAKDQGEETVVEKVILEMKTPVSQKSESKKTETTEQTENTPAKTTSCNFTLDGVS